MGIIGSVFGGGGDESQGSMEELVATKIDEKVGEKVEEAIGGTSSGITMKSPIKEKGHVISDKYGVGNVLEGEFGPFNQEVAVEGLGEGMVEEVKEEEPKYIAGQYLVKGEEEGTYYDEEEDATYSDPDGFIEVDNEGFVIDNDYEYIVDENNTIIGIRDEEMK